MAAALNFRFRESWRELRQSRPGRRFTDRYERVRREEQACGAGQRIVLVVLAVLALAIGIVLSVIPGPAIPFFFIAGGLLAAESRTIARFMDWSEVWLRKILAWIKRKWHRLPTSGRAGVLVLLACASAASAYVAFQVFVR